MSGRINNQAAPGSSIAGTPAFLKAFNEKFEQVVYAIVRFVAKIFVAVGTFFGASNLGFCQRLTKAYPGNQQPPLRSSTLPVLPSQPQLNATPEQLQRTVAAITQAYGNGDVRDTGQFLLHAVNMMKSLMPADQRSKFEKDLSDVEPQIFFQISSAFLLAILFSPQEIPADIKEVVSRTLRRRGNENLHDIDFAALNYFSQLSNSEKLTILYNPIPESMEENMTNWYSKQPMSDAAKELVRWINGIAVAISQGNPQFISQIQRVFLAARPNG